MTEEADTLQVHIDQELAEIIPSYLENRHKDILRLTDLLAKRDFETMRVLGHRMKGSGAGYGLEEVSHIGAAMEQAARNQQPEILSTLIQDLVRYLERLEIVYT
ncbi:MAG: Hpt domain-containing protein [Magnetococcales bacterium]|nr:Hpt domain-containing protein [Magnetococcales bacterium]MBF0115607.1 Hpt domain-containing protein [Magnetococcales bacterium]